MSGPGANQDSEPSGQKSSGWMVVVVALALVALFAGGGTVVAFLAARKAEEQAVSMRELAEKSRVEAMEAMARAEEEEKRAQARQEAMAAGSAPGARPGASGAVAPSDPAHPTGEGADVRTMLRTVAERLEKGEVKDPALAASLHSTIGTTYLSLGELDKAEEHLRAAVDMRKKAVGEGSPEVTADLENLARVAAARAAQAQPKPSPGGG